MKPLNHDINCYPSFQPNQVLTHFHLNRSVDYLEQQDRLTRQKLIGIGIACGLEVSLNQSGGNIEIIISQGVGVSSQGYLIRLDESNCTHHDFPCSLDESTDTPGPLVEGKCVCTHVRPFQDKAGYKAFTIPGTEEQYPILEILTDPGVTGDETIELTTDHIQNKIVVLYLEILEQEANKCLDESCDEKGKRWKFTLRKLLIDKAHMEEIIRHLHHLSPSVNLDEYFNPEYDLPEVSVERFRFKEISDSQIELEDITDIDAFKERYEMLINNGISSLALALQRMYELYGPLFNLQLETISDPFDNFSSGLTQIIENNPLTVQYIYDFILDLKAAYEELASRLFELNGKCSPPPDLFPRHLMLGELKENKIGRFDPGAYPLDKFRHHFIPAPIHNHQADLLLNIKQLAQRLALMIRDFYREELAGQLLSGDSLLKITPGKDCSAPLGHRAIPFYYKADGNPPLSDYWDFASSKRHRQDYLLGYHNSDYENDELNIVSKPLLYGICQYPKLRIEGHVGKNLSEVVARLKDLREKYNLSFDIVALKLDHTFDSVFLPEDNMIADLQAIYMVHRNDLVCSLRDFIDVLESTKNSGPLIISFLLYLMFKRDGTSMALFFIILIIIYIMYQLYTDNLRNLVENGLPADLKDFDLSRFIEAYKNVNNMSLLLKYFINTWGDVESLVSAGKDSSGSKQIYSDFLSIFLNYLELFLDKILDDSPRAQFETLHNLFINRVTTLSLFSEFNKKIHGMEHIAGTTRGGTFILVYQDYTESRDISGNVKDIEGNPVEAVEVIVNTHTHGEIRKMTDDKGKYEIRIPELQGGEKIYFTKAGYEFQAIPLADIYQSKTLDIKLEPFSFDDIKQQISKKMCGDPAINTNLLFNRMQAMTPNMKEAGIRESLISLFTGKEEPDLQIEGFNFVDNPGFQVVADFYLPNRLSFCNIEAPVQDLCPEKGKEKRKSIELKNLAKQPYEKIKKDKEFMRIIRGVGSIKIPEPEKDKKKQKKG